jgi:hypothetical protein
MCFFCPRVPPAVPPGLGLGLLCGARRALGTVRTHDTRVAGGLSWSWLVSVSVASGAIGPMELHWHWQLAIIKSCKACVLWPGMACCLLLVV